MKITNLAHVVNRVAQEATEPHGATKRLTGRTHILGGLVGAIPTGGRRATATAWGRTRRGVHYAGGRGKSLRPNYRRTIDQERNITSNTPFILNGRG